MSAAFLERVTRQIAVLIGPVLTDAHFMLRIVLVSEESRSVSVHTFEEFLGSKVTCLTAEGLSHGVGTIVHLLATASDWH